VEPRVDMDASKKRISCPNRQWGQISSVIDLQYIKKRVKKLNPVI